MAWERQEAMDWLYGPNRRNKRLSGLDSAAASRLFLSLERAGCTVEVLSKDIVDEAAAAVVLTVPASAPMSAVWKSVRESGAVQVTTLRSGTFRIRWQR